MCLGKGKGCPTLCTATVSPANHYYPRTTALQSVCTRRTLPLNRFSNSHITSASNAPIEIPHVPLQSPQCPPLAPRKTVSLFNASSPRSPQDGHSQVLYRKKCHPSSMWQYGRGDFGIAPLVPPLLVVIGQTVANAGSLEGVAPANSKPQLTHRLKRMGGTKYVPPKPVSWQSTSFIGHLISGPSGEKLAIPNSQCHRRHPYHSPLRVFVFDASSTALLLDGLW